MALPPLPLPSGVSSRQVDCPAAGLNFHYLEAGYVKPQKKPLILLLHGYPELAFSWRKIMPSLADSYHVVAIDQRGYGRTTGWDNRSFNETDLSQFTLTNLVRDIVIFANALGHRSVHCVIGHDFGAVSASMCALMRPDFFKAVALMSHPFKGSPSLPFDYAHSAEPPAEDAGSQAGKGIQADLAGLYPPRKHYKWYNSTEPAAQDWLNPFQGLKAFLRGYFHLKSADWDKNDPHPLRGWVAKELEKMPYYYIMPLDKTMPQAVAADMQGEDPAKTTTWLSDADLDVYVQEWSRTGFQGGLNWYRAQTDPTKLKDLDLFAGKKIEVPCVFISGEKDWGNYQQPGSLKNLDKTCADFYGIRFVEGAGHWLQQEQPEKVLEYIVDFLNKL